MNALSNITALPASKQEIKLFCNKAKSEILAGEYSPLIVLRQVKAIEQVLKNLKEDTDIKEYIQDEAQKHGKTFDFMGANFQVRETKKLDYSQDDIWNEYQQEIANLKALQKAREALVKTATLSNSDIADGNGELVNKVPYSTTEAIAVTIK